MNPNDAPDPALLPRDPATGEPLPQTPQPGYYTGFHTMSQKAFWDEATRDVVTMRVEQTPPIRYFTAGAGEILADGLRSSHPAA